MTSIGFEKLQTPLHYSVFIGSCYCLYYNKLVTLSLLYVAAVEEFWMLVIRPIGSSFVLAE